MGQITISANGLTGVHTVEDAKLQNVLRLLGKTSVEGFANMTQQEKADAVAKELYQMARAISVATRKQELAEEHAIYNQTELEKI